MRPSEAVGGVVTLLLVVAAVVLTAGASSVDPNASWIHRGPSSAATSLNATANFGGWTWTGTGSPCESGSHLTFYAHLFGNASGGSPPYTFTWTFGDGTNSSTGQNVTHAYLTGDGWNATLIVHDSNGAQASDSVAVYPAASSCPAEYGPNGPLFGIAELTLFGALIAAIVVGVVVVVERRARRR